MKNPGDADILVARKSRKKSKNEKTKSMNIVLPESLHRQFKLRVVAEGKTAKEVIMNFIHGYVAHDQR